MPSLSFQQQFVPGIYAMLSKDYASRTKVKPKTTTIRAMRKRPFKKGDRLFLFSGLRTKQCKRLGEAICKKIEMIGIEEAASGLFIVTVNGEMITEEEINCLARHDGFKTGAEMIKWFCKHHRFPYSGQIITMSNTYDRKYYLHKKTKDLNLKIRLTKLEKTIEITSDEVEKIKGSKHVLELAEKYQYGVQITNPILNL
jgi:hypothetical protein